MQNGFTLEEAREMHPQDRAAVVYAIAIQNGKGEQINWDTGEIEQTE